MKLQLRLLIVMVAALLAMAGILVVQHQYDLSRLHTVLDSETAQRKTYFNAILSIDQQPLETLARDYSFWDQMVDFVKTHNQTFASDNIDTSLSTFKVDVAWVYDATGKLVYASQSEDTAPLKALQLSPAMISSLKANKFAHFYVDDGTLLEVRAATIVPSDDPDHKDPAAGYWVVARKIDGAYIQQLSTLSQSANTLLSPGDVNLTKSGAAQVNFATDLKDATGTTIRELKTTYDVPIVADLNKSYFQQLVQVGVFGFILIAVVTLVLWGWVLRPIRQVILSIVQNKPALLDSLSRSSAEFGRLARTVQQFFRQKTQIAEDAIRKADLESLNKEKTIFLSVAAHELKGPISIVHMLAGDLPQVAHKLTPTQFKDQLDMVTRQTDKMATIINDLRSASQGDLNNQLEYKPQTIDFDDFLTRELKAVQLITDQTMTLTGSTGKLVSADPTRLSQVITNLVRNASKYSPRESPIEITTYADDTMVTFSVTDRGIGIADTDKDKIFERFYRAPNAAAHYQGLGIGLSVCSQIVEQFGGTISFESELQKGSTFIVRLPVLSSPTA